MDLTTNIIHHQSLDLAGPRDLQGLGHKKLQGLGGVYFNKAWVNDVNLGLMGYDYASY